MSLPLMAVWCRNCYWKRTHQDLLHYEGLSHDIESRALTNSKSHAITKDGIYTSNRDIGRYTIHESQLVNILYYRTPEKFRGKLSRPCISMNQIFWILRLQKSQRISGPLHHGQISPFLFRNLGKNDHRELPFFI